MDNETVKDQLHDYADMTERALERYIPERDCLQKNVILAARHSLTAGGKRLRPALVMEFCRVCGGVPESALPVACAIEMMHTFSLIHDDLPCMDNDDMRRGKPSCHKAFGEANALLAGDALAILPAQVIAEAGLKGTISQSAALKIIALLGEQAGIYGMIGGQVIDLMSENTNAPIEVLREMDYKKTACLIKAACELGCISAGANDKQIKAASEFGECIGIAFQIQDDILDVTSSDEELGKPVGSDAENSKSTYVSLLGIEKCRELVDELTEKAVNALHGFDGDTKELEEFAYKLAKRNK